MAMLPRMGRGNEIRERTPGRTTAGHGEYFKGPGRREALLRRRGAFHGPGASVRGLRDHPSRQWE